MKRIIDKVRFKAMRFVVSNFSATPFVKYRELVKGKIGKYDGESLIVDSAKMSQHIENLNIKGLTELDFKLSDDVVNEITSYIETLKCHDPYRPQFGSFYHNEVPSETHTAHYEREDLVNNPLILKIANDPSVLKIAEEFLGSAPTISNVNAWWSFGDKKRAEEAQNFHRDVDDYKFCKLFVYLTDVNEDSGPHVYVKGSSKFPGLKKIRRYSDDEIIEAFGKENIIELIRPKGSCFIVDTYGFHKGLLPKTGKRLLLQFQYSLNPILIETYKPKKQPTSYNKYVNRLLLK